MARSFFDTDSSPFSYLTAIGRYLGHFSQGYPSDWLVSPQFLIGTALFLGGMLINIHSDYTLIYLRKPGERGYKIPRGGCFEYISGKCCFSPTSKRIPGANLLFFFFLAANMFGEIIEWLGFAVALWSLSGFAWWIYVLGNLGPRAIAHHHWYQQKFEDYPKNRKALVPYLF